ncbi:MAG: hypothetical protein JOS17DRAFT_800010 [Linnemannia elongata]|nr:MAG: hypothetical protein JOS17DRAFT_800010 [Linnemannia elongata]
MDEIVSAAAPSYMTRILVGDQFLVWDGCDGQKSVEGNRIVYDLSFKKWATNFTASPSLQPQKPLQQKYFNCLAAVIVTILEARLAQPLGTGNLKAIVGGTQGCLFVISVLAAVFVLTKHKEDCKHTLTKDTTPPRQSSEIYSFNPQDIFT